MKLISQKQNKIEVLKDFKENRRLGADSNILYNIYLKFKVWEIVTEKDARPTERDQKKNIFASGSAILTRMEINMLHYNHIGKVV